MSDQKEPTEVFADPPALPGRWTVCAMLFVATSINYMDRQVIAILKPVLAQTTIHLAPLLPGWPVVETSIGMTEQQFGYIVSAFSTAYMLGVIFAGRLVDRLGCRRGYPIVTGLWSLSAMGHSLVNSVFGFGVARFFLGLGESGNFPAAIKATAEWFPPKERSLATGIFNSGANLGAILAPLIVPWVALHYSWHAAFLVTGFFSAVWIVLWYNKYRKPADHPTLTGAELRHIYQEAAAQMGPSAPWRKLLGFRQTWAFAIAKLLTDPIWWFFLFWLPDFFSKQYHLDLKHVGLPLVVVYTASSIGSIGGGWLPAPFLKLGFKPSSARLSAMLICACAVVPIFLVNFTHSEWMAIGLLSLAAAAHQGWSANLFTTASDMFPRTAVGSVTGIGGMAGSAGGSLFAVFIGYVLQLTHSNYTILFVIAASAYLTALAVLCLLAPGLKKVEFAA